MCRDGAGGDDSAAALAKLLTSAAQRLPRAQKALCVLPDQDGPGLQLAAGLNRASDDQRSSALPIVTGMLPSPMFTSWYFRLTSVLCDELLELKPGLVLDADMAGA